MNSDEGAEEVCKSRSVKLPSFVRQLLARCTLVDSMGKDEGSWADGFSMDFFQSCWNVVKGNLMGIFLESYVNGILSKSLNSTFITLVPKKDRLLSVSDFRHISLVTSDCKIIAKVFEEIELFVGGIPSWRLKVPLEVDIRVL